ncbi:MAG: VPLPA-CTERM sorting domain-containing protein [Gammaproteobacteria bacterium]
MRSEVSKQAHDLLIAAAIGVTAVAPCTASAGVIGFLGNFDVINDTGSTAHGFEIELEGVHKVEISDTFGGPGRGFPTGRGFDASTAVQRYGAPTITEYNNGGTFGTKVTYMGVWDGANWDFGTPSGTFITPGDNCWTGGGVGYGPSTPCDHFGVGTIVTPTKTTYSWLLETATPGALTNGTVTLPAPTWSVSPSPVAGNPPVVAAQIQAPAPENNVEFGDALWVKVFTTEIDREVELEELIGGQPVIDEAENHTEVEWALLQIDFMNPGAGILDNGGNEVGENAEAVVRRYEFYAYAGEYDSETNEAKFIKDPVLGYGDSNPAPSDIGHYLGAQNGALNLNMQFAPVPLPAAAWMFAPVLGGLFAARRRRA